MIRHLHVKNVKRIREVDVTPDGNIVTVSGLNASGKSSLIDAVWLALTGKVASKDNPRPLRDGTDEGHVELELDGPNGPLVVTRTWRRRDDDTVTSTLAVRSGDGAVYQSPQKMLDDMMGRLSFDPLAFTRMPPKEQVKLFLHVADADFDPDALEAERQAAYHQRTQIGREERSLRAQWEAMPHDPTVPDTEVETGDVIAAINAAQATARDNQRHRDALAAAKAHADRCADRVSELAEQLARARADYGAAEEAVSTAAGRCEGLTDPDMAEFTDRLTEIEDINDRVRRNRQRAEVGERLDLFAESYREHTATIDAIDARRAEAVANADLGVPGLGLDDDGLTLDGLPFVQASSAQQMRTAMAFAFRMNPDGLRIVRITDGSLLDDESTRVVEEMAETAGAQVFLEVVTPDAVGVHIEDGAVA